MSDAVNLIGLEISRGPIQGNSVVGGSDLVTNSRPAVPNVFHFAQMTELLVGQFQQNWFTGGRLSVRYLKPLQQGEEVVVKEKIISFIVLFIFFYHFFYITRRSSTIRIF